jgi:hypothetical protein
VNVNELVEHIIKTGTRGVWFWNSGANFAPHDVACAYSNAVGVHTQTPAGGILRDSERSESFPQIVELLSRYIGPSYRAGQVALFTGVPPSPTLRDLRGLVAPDETHHIWYDRVDKRGDKFAVFIDAITACSVEDVARAQHGHDWARRTLTERDTIAAQVKECLEGFTEVKVVHHGSNIQPRSKVDLVIVKEAKQ